MGLLYSREPAGWVGARRVLDIEAERGKKVPKDQQCPLFIEKKRELRISHGDVSWGWNEGN